MEVYGESKSLTAWPTNFPNFNRFTFMGSQLQLYAVKLQPYA